MNKITMQSNHLAWTLSHHCTGLAIKLCSTLYWWAFSDKQRTAQLWFVTSDLGPAGSVFKSAADQQQVCGHSWSLETCTLFRKKLKHCLQTQNELAHWHISFKNAIFLCKNNCQMPDVRCIAPSGWSLSLFLRDCQNELLSSLVQFKDRIFL